MKRIIFSGVGCALITPFRDGAIDFSALGELINIQIESGVSAIVIGGTTGECATLSDDERYRLYSFSHSLVGGRAALILGVGTNDTKAAMRHTILASQIGCDGVLAVTPYYNKGTESGIVKHYLQIAEASTVPVLLYNVPSRTGVNLSYSVLSALAEHENIVGIKEASDSADRYVYLSEMSDKLALYAGNDTQLYTALSLGGLGVISVAANPYPRQ
ncbi:MAG: 4-hydroxy-tetrahydrodipicolinate synthase, partial [Clostridia bacterium]|nr:4-hydroxy-tetrahydrodipicolinate synthase [Clostridia bacterium]